MPTLEFQSEELRAAEVLIGLALAEDLQETGDLTSQALIDPGQQGEIKVVAREAGIVAGNPVAELVFRAIGSTVTWLARIPDGSKVEPGAVIATVQGPMRTLLEGERTALNFLTQLSGVATLTNQFVTLVEGTKARILDTRKTWPGFRRLEKYAVRAGGGTNHRMGLFDGVLIKDNHLAAWRIQQKKTIADAIRTARDSVAEGISIEVEVDTLEQLKDALAGNPDIVLLDNMSNDGLREAIAIRNELAPSVLLEASGGVKLETVREIAETGVDRISIGALTHSVKGLDIGFDWS